MSASYLWVLFNPLESHDHCILNDLTGLIRSHDLIHLPCSFQLYSSGGIIFNRQEYSLKLFLINFIGYGMSYFSWGNVRGVNGLQIRDVCIEGGTLLRLDNLGKKCRVLFHLYFLPPSELIASIKNVKAIWD